MSLRGWWGPAGAMQEDTGSGLGETGGGGEIEGAPENTGNLEKILCRDRC